MHELVLNTSVLYSKYERLYIIYDEFIVNRNLACNINLNVVSYNVVSCLHLYEPLRYEYRRRISASILHHWNGVNMFNDSNNTSYFNMQLYTDASYTIRYGCDYQEKLVSSTWPQEVPTLNDKSLSMVYLEI